MFAENSATIDPVNCVGKGKVQGKERRKTAVTAAVRTVYAGAATVRFGILVMERSNSSD